MRPGRHRLTAAQVAVATGQTLRSVQRWLALWHAAGVRGIERVPARGRYGAAYVVHPSVVRRWRAGMLPVPHESQLARAA